MFKRTTPLEQLKEAQKAIGLIMDQMEVLTRQVEHLTAAQQQAEARHAAKIEELKWWVSTDDPDGKPPGPPEEIDMTLPTGVFGNAGKTKTNA